MTAASRGLRTSVRPSIRDVARHAGVSAGCVSNVMNGRRRQDDPIGRAVLQAVDELGYRRNTMASNLRRAQSRIIGLVIPDFENPFFAELVSQLERCAEATGYRIVAASSREDCDIEAREIDELAGWRVSGILLIPSVKSRAQALIAESATPFVLLDRIFAGTSADAVGVDNAEASEAVVHRLVGLGHRRILVAYLGGGIDNVTERLDGVRRASSDAGDGVTVDYLPTATSVEAARSALAGYLDSNPAPDAVFCLFNTATLAAYGLLLERGLEPGVKTALVGFDDSAWMAHVHPPVAAIVQPVRAIAEHAWARILARVEGDDSPGIIQRLSCVLEPRRSLETVSSTPRSRGRAAQ